MMKTLRNSKGSTLSTAIIVLLVVLSLTTGMYVLGVLYYRQSEQNHYSRQAYLFAKSECKVFSQYLSNEGQKSPFFPDPKANTSDATAIKKAISVSQNTTSSNSLVDGITENKVEYRWYGANEIKYKVTVKYKGETSEVTISCTKPSDDTTYKSWKFLYE